MQIIKFLILEIFFASSDQRNRNFAMMWYLVIIGPASPEF